MRIIDADELINRMYHDAFETDTDMQKWDSGCWIRYKMFENAIDEQPTIEPNLILPERMERGECYEVGETIVVMNHDDYYDLLCKPTVDKDYLVSLIQEAVYDGEACKRLLDLVDRPQGEWILCSERLPEDIRPVLVTWKNNGPASYYQYIVGKHFIGTAHYHRGKWYWYSSVTEDLLAEYGKCDAEEFDEAIEAVAWMPLPTPYKEGSRR